jgi:hypothetical protein
MDPGVGSISLLLLKLNLLKKVDWLIEKLLHFMTGYLVLFIQTHLIILMLILGQIEAVATQAMTGTYVTLIPLTLGNLPH